MQTNMNLTRAFHWPFHELQCHFEAVPTTRHVSFVDYYYYYCYFQVEVEIKIEFCRKVFVK